MVKRKMETKTTLLVTKKSLGTFSSKDLNDNFEINVDSYPNQRLADAKKRSTEQLLPRLISHPNGIVRRVFKQNRGNYTAGKKRGSLAANGDKRKRRRIADRASISLTALVVCLNESILDIEVKTETAKQRLPIFISHPN